MVSRGTLFERSSTGKRAGIVFPPAYVLVYFALRKVRLNWHRQPPAIFSPHRPPPNYALACEQQCASSMTILVRRPFLAVLSRAAMNIFDLTT